MNSTPKSKDELNKLKIVFFDGYCNLCCKLVENLLKKDKRNRLHYASQQSEFARNFLARNLLDSGAVIFFNAGKFYTRSTAIIKIMNQLGGVYKFSSVLLIVPPFIRDFFYRWVSRKRYLWFGTSDSCYLPQPDFKIRFLDYEKKNEV